MPGEAAVLSLGIDATGAVTGVATFQRAGSAITASSAKIGASLKATDTAMKSMGSTAALVGKGMAAMFGGLAAISALRKTISVVAEFESTMATVLSVTGATTAKFAQLTNAARLMGATTRFTASEAAEGILFLSRAGFEANEAMRALPGTLNLAAAGALELGEAADFASNILSGFALATSETTRVVDTMLKTANSANTNVRQLAEAMKFVAPVAAALGVSVEQTAAAIGVMGNAGIQASLAGTGLRKILISLIEPSDKAKTALQGLGLTEKDISLTTNSLSDIFRKLRDAGLEAGEAQELFGLRAISAAIAIRNQVGEMDALTEANQQAGGAAQEAADIMENTLAGSFRSLRSAVSEMMLQAGDRGLLATLRSLTDTGTDVARMLAGMNSAFIKNHEAASKVIFVLKAIGVALAALVAIKVAAAFFAIAIAIGSAGAALITLNVSLLASPLVSLPALMAGSIIALATFRNKLIDIGDEFVSVQNIATGVFTVLGNQAKAAFETLPDTLKQIKADIADFFGFAPGDIFGPELPGNTGLTPSGASTGTLLRSPDPRDVARHPEEFSVVDQVVSDLDFGVASIVAFFKSLSQLEFESKLDTGPSVTSPGEELEKFKLSFQENLALTLEAAEIKKRANFPTAAELAFAGVEGPPEPTVEKPGFFSPIVEGLESFVEQVKEVASAEEALQKIRKDLRKQERELQEQRERFQAGPPAGSLLRSRSFEDTFGSLSLERQQDLSEKQEFMTGVPTGFDRAEAERKSFSKELKDIDGVTDAHLKMAELKRKLAAEDRKAATIATAQIKKIIQGIENEITVLGADANQREFVALAIKLETKFREDLGDQLDEELQKLQSLFALKGEEEERIERIEKKKKAQDSAKKSLDQLIQSLEDEIRISNIVRNSTEESTLARDRAITVMEAERLALAAFTDLEEDSAQSTDEFGAVIEEVTELVNEYFDTIGRNRQMDDFIDKSKEAKEAIDALITSLEKDVKRVSMTPGQRELDRDLEELRKIEDTFNKGREQRRQKVEDEFGLDSEGNFKTEIGEDELGIQEGEGDFGVPDFGGAEEEIERLNKLKEIAKTTKNIADGVGNAFADSFGDVIKGTKTVEEAFEDMAVRIGDILIEELILRPIAELISQLIQTAVGAIAGFIVGGPAGAASFGGLGGGAPSSAIFDTFAEGGIIDRPTFALLGEKGPEVVLPLRGRGRQGEPIPTPQDLRRILGSRVKGFQSGGIVDDALFGLIGENAPAQPEAVVALERIQRLNFDNALGLFSGGGLPGLLGGPSGFDREQLGSIKQRAIDIFKPFIDPIGFFGEKKALLHSIVPGLGISFPKFPGVTGFAEGGIVNSPTRAILGERGPEVRLSMVAVERALQSQRIAELNARGADNIGSGTAPVRHAGIRDDEDRRGNLTVNLNLQGVRDFDSFRKSSVSVGRQLRRIVQGF